MVSFPGAGPRKHERYRKVSGNLTAFSEHSVSKTAKKNKKGHLLRRFKRHTLIIVQKRRKRKKKKKKNRHHRGNTNNSNKHNNKDGKGVGSRRRTRQ
jgi:hypothetical protein